MMNERASIAHNGHQQVGKVKLLGRSREEPPCWWH